MCQILALVAWMVNAFLRRGEDWTPPGKLGDRDGINMGVDGPSNYNVKMSPREAHFVSELSFGDLPEWEQQAAHLQQANAVPQQAALDLEMMTQVALEFYHVDWTGEEGWCPECGCSGPRSIHLNHLFYHQGVCILPSKRDLQCLWNHTHSAVECRIFIQDIGGTHSFQFQINGEVWWELPARANLSNLFWKWQIVKMVWVAEIKKINIF